MRTPTLLAIAATGLVALAGCGSSSKTTSSSAGSAGTSSAGNGGGGAYGHASATTPTTASSSGSASGTGVAVASKHSKLGTILAAGPKKLTVYLFEGDKGTTSMCTGACASVWPPVTTSAAATAATGAMAADLGTTMRSDGTKQVTYKGHPLYFFAKDKDSGDAYGQGSKAFGADWYVLKPSGEKVDNS